MKTKTMMTIMMMLLHLLWASVVIAVNRLSNAFLDAHLTLSPALERVSLDMTLAFTINTNTSNWNAIAFHLPQFTTSNCDGTAGYSIANGGVRLKPSIYFSGEWVEGSFNKGVDPYANSTLILYFKSLEANVSALSTFEVTIMKANGIKAYCGYTENWDQLRISTNSTSFGVNSTDWTTLATDELGMGCGDILHNCSSHGSCDYCLKRCSCDEGWGAATDMVGDYTMLDCSTRVCPRGKSWANIPQGAYDAHQIAECSNNGICDRDRGTCRCFSGFTGDTCQRRRCPNDCSGRGQCLTMAELAVTDEALPLTQNTEYGTLDNRDHKAWDFEALSGCVCDSSWDVGLGPGQVQEPEFFGPDCSLRHCPTGDDPETPDIDETDCSEVVAAGGLGVGKTGNLCHVDCSNRGICDYSNGKCKCFENFYGDNCGKKRTVGKLSFARSAVGH